MGGSFFAQTLAGICAGVVFVIALRWPELRRVVRFRQAYLAATSEEQAHIRHERVYSYRHGMRLVALVVGILSGIFLLGGIIAFLGGDGFDAFAMLAAALGYLSIVGLGVGLGGLFSRLLMPRR